MFSINFNPDDFCKDLAKSIIKGLKEEKGIPEEERWIDSEETMKILHCKKDKLLQLRREEQIKYSTKSSTVLYEKESIYTFLEETSNGPI